MDLIIIHNTTNNLLKSRVRHRVMNAVLSGSKSLYTHVTNVNKNRFTKDIGSHKIFKSKMIIILSVVKSSCVQPDNRYCVLLIGNISTAMVENTAEDGKMEMAYKLDISDIAEHGEYEDENEMLESLQTKYALFAK